MEYSLEENDNIIHKSYDPSMTDIRDAKNEGIEVIDWNLNEQLSAKDESDDELDRMIDEAIEENEHSLE